LKLYARYNNEICELVKYQNTRSDVQLESPSEGRLFVQKNKIEIIGFRNGKGATGELQTTNEADKREVERYLGE
jgi:hypothetical protein